MVGVEDRRCFALVSGSPIDIRSDVRSGIDGLRISTLDGDLVDDGIEVTSSFVIGIVPIDHACNLQKELETNDI